MSESDPRYPIGRFDWNAPLTSEMRTSAINEIECLPGRLRDSVAGLTDEQLDTPYRDHGWTVRQLVHHVADSHINALIRLKLALTEDNPPAKAYDQDAWSQLPDSRLPIDVSLMVLDGVHARWTAISRSLTDGQLARTFQHGEHGRVPLERQLQLYAWHGRHHVGHILALRARQSW